MTGKKSTTEAKTNMITILANAREEDVIDLTHMEEDESLEYQALSGEDDVAETNVFFSFWNIFKELSAISIPMALSFTFSFEIFLMTILLNTLSENEDDVAAATLSATMINTLAVIGMSPLFAMSVIASKKIGELEEAEKNNEHEESLILKREYIAGINRNGFLMSTLVTPPIMAGMFFSKPILTNLLGQNEHVALITQDFLRVYSPAVFALMTRVSTEQMMFSFKRTKQAMSLGLVSLAVGTGLSVWLGIGGLGVPKLGSTGIAVGYVVESYLTSLSYGLYLAKNKDFSRFEFFNVLKKFEGQWTQFKELLKIGSSITLTVASEMAMSLSVGLFSGILGTREQSAITNINQYVFFNFLALASFGQSNSQELNRLIGAKKYEHASQMGKYGLLTTMIYTAPIPLFFALFPDFLVISSGNQSEVKAMLQFLAPIMSIGVILDSVRNNLLQQLRVLHDLKGSTIISVSSLTIGIATSALFGLKTKMGVYGVALGYSGGIILACPGLLYRWQSRINAEKMKGIIEAPPRPVSSVTCIDHFFNKSRKINNTNGHAKGLFLEKEQLSLSALGSS